MDIADVKAMKGDGVGVSIGRVWVAGLAILLSLCVLHDDGNAEELLSGKLEG